MLSATQPQYLYSTGRDVLSVSVNISLLEPQNVSLSAPSSLFDGDFDSAQALGFHHQHQLLFISDTTRGAIYRTPATGHNMAELTVQQPHVEGTRPYSPHRPG